MENLSAEPNVDFKMNMTDIDHLLNFLSPLAPSLQIVDEKNAPS